MYLKSRAGFAVGRCIQRFTSTGRCAKINLYCIKSESIF